MERDIKDYLHLYIGCQVKRTDIDDYGWTLVGVSASEVEPGRTVAIIGGPVFQEWYAEETRPILRPLSDMIEDDFKEFAKPKSFAVYQSYWYACERETDPEFEGDIVEHIQDACDDDPENVIMFNTRDKSISYGWISYDEVYHSFSTKEHADWFKFLLSKGFDLFNLIPDGLAIDATTINKATS